MKWILLLPPKYQAQIHEFVLKAEASLYYLQGRWRSGTTGTCRTRRGCTGIQHRLELLVFPLVQESKLCQPYTSRNVPGDEIQLFAEATPATDNRSGYFGSIRRLALIDGGGGFERVLSLCRFADSISICSAAALAALPMQVPRKPETGLLPVRTGVFIQM